jgi:hypothetical protein
MLLSLASLIGSDFFIFFFISMLEFLSLFKSILLEIIMTQTLQERLVDLNGAIGRNIEKRDLAIDINEKAIVRGLNLRYDSKSGLYLSDQFELASGFDKKIVELDKGKFNQSGSFCVKLGLYDTLETNPRTRVDFVPEEDDYSIIGVVSFCNGMFEGEYINKIKVKCPKITNEIYDYFRGIGVHEKLVEVIRGVVNASRDEFCQIDESSLKEFFPYTG